MRPYRVCGENASPPAQRSAPPQSAQSRHSTNAECRMRNVEDSRQATSCATECPSAALPTGGCSGSQGRYREGDTAFLHSHTYTLRHMSYSIVYAHCVYRVVVAGHRKSQPIGIGSSGTRVWSTPLVACSLDTHCSVLLGSHLLIDFA